MGPFEVILAGFLAIAVAMAIVIYFPTCCKLARYEGFTDKPKTLKCPKGTKTYTDLLGNTNCCEGTVSGTHCEGAIKCTLSAPKDNAVPTCSALRKKYLQEMNKKCIFEEMPYYFETDSRSGCAKQVTEEGDEPVPSNAKVCYLYGGDADKYQTDSCLTMKKYQNKIYIKSHIRPNFCINLPGGNSDNGVIINGWDCHMGDNQKFEYRKETGEIKNLVTGKCLDGWNPENRNGTKVVQWECHGGIQQSWFLDDKQRIRHRQNPSKCLDFPSSERGTRLTTWDCHDGSNQKFDNVPV